MYHRLPLDMRMPKLIDRFRAAAFDLDGTLIDSMPDLTAAVSEMLRELGMKPLPEPSIRKLVGAGVEQLVLGALTLSSGAAADDPVQLSAALAVFQRAYSKDLYVRSSLYPGVQALLQSLSQGGLRLCCITNKSSLFALPLLEMAGVLGYFSFTLCADRLEDRKPSPGMLITACARLGVPAGEMLYVGDSRVDVLAARQAGCPVVAVSYGYGSRESLVEAQPDRIVDTVPELLAAVAG
jgi:phosphoglycolate phosphatase